MDDALVVRALECLGDLDRDGHRFVERDRPLGNAIGQGWSFDQFHDQRAHLQVGAGSFQAKHLRDVGMIERGQRLGFPLKPREAFGIEGERVGQYLDCDRPAQVGVYGAINLAHAADAKRAGDFEGADARTDGQGHG